MSKVKRTRQSPMSFSPSIREPSRRSFEMEVDNRDYHYLSQNEIGGRRGFDSNPDWNVLRFLQYCVDRLCGVKSPIAEVVNG